MQKLVYIKFQVPFRECLDLTFIHVKMDFRGNFTS